VSRALAGAPAAGAQRLDRRRVYIFPTRHGFVLAPALALMLLGAINYDISLGYAVAFLLAGLAMVALLHTWRNLLHLQCIGARGATAFAGRPAEFQLGLDNRGRAARRAVVFARSPGRGGLFRSPAEGAVCCDIPADSLYTVSLRTGETRRGRLALGRVLVETRFPLGLARAWSYLDLPAEVLVYPRPRGRLPLPFTGTGERRTGGSSGRSGEDFLGFRAYLAGDLPKRIDWKVLARSDELVVRRFAAGEAGRVRLDWAAAAPAGGVETRLEQLCQWVLEAERRGLAYALEIPGTTLATASGERHKHRCLSALALFRATPA